MYLKYFGLTERPFSIAPDPQYLYMSARHREAMAHLSYGLSQGGCFIVLTGEVGTGKTTLCRNLLADLPENVNAALILNPNINRRELLETVCDELKLSYPEGQSKKKLLDAINEHLLVAYAENKHTVLIIDEAQLLSPTVLEQVRLLTNLETTKSKLLQIILIGQPELSEVLARNDLRQLSQRVTARYHLPAISAGDIQEYVNFRLEVAGCKKPLFSAQALKLLHQLSEGIPRKINVLADQALLGAYANSQLIVDTRTLKAAAGDVLGNKSKGIELGSLNSKWRWGSLVALLLLVNITGWWFYGQKLNQAVSTPQQVQDIEVPLTPGVASENQSLIQYVDSSNIELTNEVDVVEETVDQSDPLSGLAGESLNGTDNDIGADTGTSTGTEAISQGSAAPESAATIDLSQLSTSAPEEVLASTKDNTFESGAVVFSEDFLEPTPIESESLNAVSDQSADTFDQQSEAFSQSSYLANSAFGRVLEASSDRTGRVAAFRNLASAWDADLSGRIFRPLCEELAIALINCLPVSDWSTLLRLNRPTIMVLSHNGVQHRVILHQLEGPVASVLVGEQTYDLPASELVDRWSGNALLFWRPSSLGSEFLQLGDRSATIPLIRARINSILSSLNLAAMENENSVVFDAELAERVGEVQRRYGILADGKVGQETYLLINELLSANEVPTLVTRSGF